EDVKEAVLVGLNHYLPALAADLDVRENLLVRGVDVVHVVRRVLEVADHLTRLRANRQQTVRIQAIQILARPWIVGLGVARAPVDEIEFGIVGTRPPRRPATLRPGLAVFRPCFGAWLSWSRDRVAAPQLLSGIGIPAVQETACCRFAARDSG